MFPRAHRRRGGLSRGPASVNALLLSAASGLMLLAAAAAPAAFAQAKSTVPAVSTIRVTVDVLDPAGQPISGADTVLRQETVTQGPIPRHPFDVELRTDNHGQVTVQGFQPGIVLIQIIANGYQTYGQAFIMKHANETVHVRLDPPRPQVSSFH